MLGVKVLNIDGALLLLDCLGLIYLQLLVSIEPVICNQRLGRRFVRKIAVVLMVLRFIKFPK